ncbi:MAG: DUF6049 family protein [Actinomycetaceae bacterium]|nr:DUF6049 family protein [Actinomycetaceae bacterium]
MSQGRKATGFKSLLAVAAAASVGFLGVLSPTAALGKQFAGGSETTQSLPQLALLPAQSTLPRQSTLPAQHPQDEELSIRIDNLHPRVLTDEAKLVVEGTVFVKQATPVLNLVVRVGTATPLNAEQLQAYLKQQSFAGQWVAHTQLKDVPAQKLTRFKIEIPRASLPLGNEWEWGPRGIEVAAESSSARAADRSLLIWDSQVKVAPSRIHAVAPVPVRADFVEGRVTTQLPTVADWQFPLEAAQIRGVSLAVPADVLQSEFAQQHLQQAASELLAVPVGNPDVVAVSKLPASADFLTQLRAQVEAEDFGQLRVRKDVVVPLVPKPDSQLEQSLLPDTPALIDAQVLRQWAGWTVISGELELDAPWQYNYSPGTFGFYKADGTLSASAPAEGGLLLTTQQSVDQVFNRVPASADELLDDTQFLRAVSATLTRERPFEPRSFLTLLPANGWHPAQVERLRALLENRWVATQAAFYTSEDAGSTAPLRTATGEPAHPVVFVQQADLKSLEVALAKALPMAKAIGAQDQVRAEYLLSKQFLLGESATADSQLHAKIVSNFETRMQEFAQLIRVAEPSTINLVDKNANLPLRLINESGSAAQVKVRLQPSDPRLRIEDVVTVKIRGNSQQAVEFPVKAIGSGDVEVQVIVTASDDTVINADAKFMVRVRADWESNATAVMMFLVVLAFIYGLFRTLRRNRKQARERELGVVEELNEANDE